MSTLNVPLRRPHNHRRTRHTRRAIRLGSGAALVAALLTGLPRLAAADQTPQALPFTQNWANVGLITANDTWTGVVGIEGYLGQDITTATGVDPQTLLGTSTLAADLDVIANQTNTSITNGGVAEFEIADPTIALQGSNTADAPYVLITVNTTGASSIPLSYTVRDLDGSADNAIQQVALQYRVGTTGNFTNIAAGYIADATTGGTAIQVTSRTAVLPSAADNQPVVQLRVITTNAVGSDEWVGIDDIVVGGTAPGDAAPSVSVTTPANNATGVGVASDVAITFSEPVTATGAFAISCTTSGAHPVTVTGGPTTWTLNPDTDFVTSETCTATVTASLVTDVDATDPPDAMAANYVFSFATVATDPCTSAFTPIYAIQGSGTTPAVTGVATTKGVVVGDYEYPGTGATADHLRGFYIQAETGDGDAATSDAIFVFNGNNNSVALGDVVVVAGTAGEFQDQTQLSTVTSITNCGTATVAPTDIALPAASPTAFEAFEGMLVRFRQTLYVTEHFQLGRFGQVVVSSTDRLRQPTSVVAPGAPAVALQASNNLNKLIIDDASQRQNPDPILFGRSGNPLSATNTLRGGDTTTDPVGVLSYTWAGNAASGNAFRLRPINALNGSVQFTAVNARPTAPVVGGTLRAAGLNLLNFFNTFDGLPDTVDNCLFGTAGAPADCRGADTQTEFDRQWPKTVAAIVGMNVDVIGINEIENDGYGATSAIAFLVDRLNAATAPGTFAFIDADANTGQVDALGTDAIKVGLLYKPAKVTPVGTTAALNTVAFVNAGDLGPRNRASLAQAFEQNSNGARFVVNVNHFKSKGSACDAADANDGQGNCAAVRANAATQLAAWLATNPTGTNDPDVLLLGDYNSYAKEDAITALKNGGYTNLAESLIGANAYSYVFDGQWGYLDYALSSASLLTQIAGVTEHHINADEPSVLDYNTDFKTANLQATLYAPDQYRVSDHDPIVVGLNLNKPGTTTALAVAPVAPIAGQPFDLTATVAAATGSAVPVGSVAFSDGTPLGNVVVDATGKAVLAQQRGVGSYNYTASFTGNERFGDSNSSLTVNVAQAPSTVTLTAPSSAILRSPVSLVATVTSPYLVPTGTVTFYDGPTPVSGAIALVPSSAANTATASFTWTAAPRGTHPLTVVYSGDTNVLTGTSAVVPVSVARLKIRQVCTGTNNARYNVFTWTVTNESSDNVTFDWRVRGAVPPQTGTLTVPANATSVEFTTNRWSEDTVLQILVNGAVVDRREAERNRTRCLNASRDDD